MNYLYSSTLTTDQGTRGDRLCIICPGLCIICPGLCITCPGLCIICPGLCIICPGLCIICPGLCITCPGLCITCPGLCITFTRRSSLEVACINAQFVDNAVFQYVNGHYNSAVQLTFHGNNFQDLPEGPLFGSHTLDRLRVLNISANYIVNLHRNALRGAPNIEVLDLSNNEIVLGEENIHFLSHTPRLRKLFLRRRLTPLLDLSYNFFSNVPSQLPCPFPSLRHLDLRQNLLGSLFLNSTCLAHIGTINLERNYFHSLDAQFRTFATELAARTPLVQFLLRNSFFCDCSSVEWIQWLREHSGMMADYRFLICSRASPQKLSGSRLSEVPLGHLDCQTDLLSSAAGSAVLSVLSLIPLLILSAHAVLSTQWNSFGRFD
uniref:LRRCT domain-containing protein n=1 Tax=Globodera pallida TaxID=36090 RepID=A0A183C3T7_GLOPA